MYVFILEMCDVGLLKIDCIVKDSIWGLCTVLRHLHILHDFSALDTAWVEIGPLGLPATFFRIFFFLMSLGFLSSSFPALQGDHSLAWAWAFLALSTQLQLHPVCLATTAFPATFCSQYFHPFDCNPYAEHSLCKKLEISHSRDFWSWNICKHAIKHLEDRPQVPNTKSMDFWCTLCVYIQPEGRVAQYSAHLCHLKSGVRFPACGVLLAFRKFPILEHLVFES